MSDEELKTGSGKPGPGRPPHALNKISRDIKEGLLNGAILSDYAKDLNNDDPDAPGSLTQYMRTVANRHPELFFQAITKLIPKEVKQYMHNETSVNVVYETVDQVKTAMLEAGMSQREIAMIERALPGSLDEDAT